MIDDLLHSILFPSYVIHVWALITLRFRDDRREYSLGVHLHTSHSLLITLRGILKFDRSFERCKRQTNVCVESDIVVNAISHAYLTLGTAIDVVLGHIYDLVDLDRLLYHIDCLTTLLADGLICFQDPQSSRLTSDMMRMSMTRSGLLRVGIAVEVELGQGL